jgi:hypothetical protein
MIAKMDINAKEKQTIGEIHKSERNSKEGGILQKYLVKEIQTVNRQYARTTIGLKSLHLG